MRRLLLVLALACAGCTSRPSDAFIPQRVLDVRDACVAAGGKTYGVTWDTNTDEIGLYCYWSVKP